MANEFFLRRLARIFHKSYSPGYPRTAPAGASCILTNHSRVKSTDVIGHLILDLCRTDAYDLNRKGNEGKEQPSSTRNVWRICHLLSVFS